MNAAYEANLQVINNPFRNAGTYSYGSQPHAVSSIAAPAGSAISTVEQKVYYNPFNKVRGIRQGTDSVTIAYSPAVERCMQKEYENTTTLKRTIYYFHNYEEYVTVGIAFPTRYHYIYTPDGLVAIMNQFRTTKTMQYVAKDHLGSVMALYSDSRTLIEEFSYDAWGRRRNPTNWTYTNVPTATNTRHGYTGHEHLDKFALINMNGRVYDPVIGRFLSPDPYIQAPYFAPNFDRYSYVWNNPLKYIDPSGYLMVPIYRDHGLSGIGVSRRRQNDELDWIYGRGVYAIDGPAVSGLVLRWLVTTGGGGGMPQASWITTSSSGMVISGNSEYNGTYQAVTTHNGQTGSWVQVSGAITYGVINGRVVAVVNAGATCVWVASGVNNGYIGNDINFTGSNWWNAGTGINGLISGAAGSTYRAVSAASTEAQAMKMIGITSNTTKVIGIAGSITNVFVSGINAYNHRNSGDAGFYNSKLVGSAIIAATAFIPIVGPVLSIGLGAVDAAGGFDGIYHYTGSPVFQYQMIGISSGIGW